MMDNEKKSQECDEIFELIIKNLREYYKGKEDSDGDSTIYVFGWLFVRGMMLYSKNRSDLKNKVNVYINHILDQFQN